MPEIRHLQCPTCGAGLDVAIGALRVRCAHCGTSSAVEANQGEVFLRAADKITSAVRAEGQATQEALRRLELNQRRMQVVQDISSVRSQLDGLTNEVNHLMGLPKKNRATKARSEYLTRTVRPQLMQHLAGLQHQVATIDATLNPSQAVSHVTPSTTAMRPLTQTGSNGCVAFLGKAMLITFGVAILIAAVGYLSPFLIIGSLGLLVLAWRKPDRVIRIANSRRLARLPAWMCATPMRFAGFTAAIVIPLSAFFGMAAYSPREPTPTVQSVASTPGGTVVALATSASPTLVSTTVATLPTMTLAPTSIPVVVSTPMSTPAPTLTMPQSAATLPLAATATSSVVLTERDGAVTDDLRTYLHDGFRDASWYRYIRGVAVKGETAGISTTLGTSSGERQIANTICNATLNYVRSDPGIDIKFGSVAGIGEVVVFSQEGRSLTTCRAR